MAKSVSINSVTYPDVPYVVIPLSSGGGNATFYDTGSADASASHILQGKKAYGASGEIVGTLTTPSISQDGTTKVLTIS